MALQNPAIDPISQTPLKHFRVEVEVSIRNESFLVLVSKSNLEQSSFSKLTEHDFREGTHYQVRRPSDDNYVDSPKSDWFKDAMDRKDSTKKVHWHGIMADLTRNVQGIHI